MRRLAAVVLLVALAGCYGGSSGPTPGDMVDVLGALTANGATMTDTIAGDAGCNDQTLVDNARRLTLSFAPDGKSYTVYIFRWYNNADYSEAAAAFAACVAAYQQANPGVDVQTADLSPWRAFGPAWPPALKSAVTGALQVAAAGQ